MRWIDELRSLLQRLRREAPEPGREGGLSCQESAERILEWLDGELDPEMTERVGEHLNVCARCYPRLAFETAFRQAVARVPRAATVPDELEARILADLKERGFTPS